MERVKWAYKTREAQHKDNLNIPYLIVGIILILVIADTIRKERQIKEDN